MIGVRVVLACGLLAGWAFGQGGERVYYYHADHLGSVRMQTDGQGAVANVYDYLPFGEEVAGPAAGGPGFTGKWRGPETGRDYFEARYYSPPWGRFLSVDPARTSASPFNPQSWNRYTYAHNNPILLVDPDGQSATAAGAVTGGLIGGGMAYWQGKRGWRAISAAAARGALEGALIGSVIDSGGASLPLLLGAGGVAHAAGGTLERAILGQPTTSRDIQRDLAVGASVPPILGSIRQVPLGFPSEGAFRAVVRRLRVALGGEAAVGIRGSSVTGVRYRTGEAVDARTVNDYDFLAVSTQLVEQLGGQQALRRGYIDIASHQYHNFPGFKEILKEVLEKTGKPASVRVFTREYFEKKVNPNEVLFGR